MSKFNSPAFAIRYLRRSGHLLKERPASDLKDNKGPILTFTEDTRPGTVCDAMIYLRDEHGYTLKLEKYFVDTPSW